MELNIQNAIDHGLNKDEFNKICDLLKRTPNLTELGVFQRCGMNTVHINHQRFI